jgi:hypothetical protein
LGNLIFDKAGNLYGATDFGGGRGNTCNQYYGGNCGTVFKLIPPKQKGGQWTEQVLHSFAGGTDGANPYGGLVLDAKGALYGATLIGGDESGECDSSGCGTVFRLRPPTKKGGPWAEEILHRFKGPDGATPGAGVIFGKDGNLYGAVSSGGNQGYGGIFELTKPAGKSRSWTENVLYLFTGGTDGYSPMAGVIFGAHGDLYGTAQYALSSSGTIFRLTPVGPNEVWKFEVLYGFAGPPDGAEPMAGLVFDKAGNLYSTTRKGGTGTACQFGCGTVFQSRP